MEASLERDVENLKAKCREMSLQIIRASVNTEEMPVVNFSLKGSSLNDYLTLAKTLQAPAIFIDQMIFDEGTIAKFRTTGSDDDNDTEIDEEDIDEAFEKHWESLEKEHQKYVGGICVFMLHFYKDGVFYYHHTVTDYYVKLRETARQLKEELEARRRDEDDEEEIPELSENQIEDCASELARFELFQKAANQNSRRLALRKKFPKVAQEQSAQQINEVIGRAKGIFDLEVKPELEKQLDAEISSMAERELTKEQISKKLRISLARVRKVL